MEAIKERLESLKTERQAKIEKAKELRKCEDDYQKELEKKKADVKKVYSLDELNQLKSEISTLELFMNTLPARLDQLEHEHVGTEDEYRQLSEDIYRVHEEILEEQLLDLFELMQLTLSKAEEYTKTLNHRQMMINELQQATANVNGHQRYAERVATNHTSICRYAELYWAMQKLETLSVYGMDAISIGQLRASRPFLSAHEIATIDVDEAFDKALNVLGRKKRKYSK